MQAILRNLQEKKCWKSFLKTQCRKNCVDPEIAGSFTIVKIRKFFEKLNTIDISNRPRLKSSCWLQNELKAYHWVLIAVSGMKDRLVQKFKQEQWSQLSDIFNKQETILQYEAIKLVNQKQNKKKWDKDETQILMKIIAQDTSNNKWNEIARKLFEVSDKIYFRSGKQCRERWLNHLDPNKKHGDWSQRQDRNIVQFIMQKGKKWSEISKLLGNQRTEHMVKNRFKTILIRQKKIAPELKSEADLLKNFMLTEGNSENQENQEVKVDKIIEESEHKSQSYDLEVGDNLGALKEKVTHQTTNTNFYDFQQVHTPCPMIYQCFTPNFLQSPHPIPFFMTNCSFDRLGEREDLFLKENN